MWVSGWDDEEIDTNVQDDCSTPYQVVEVGAAETNQPAGEQSEDLMPMYQQGTHKLGQLHRGQLNLKLTFNCS